MNKEEIDDAVYEIVDDFLADGVEYIAIAEYVGEEFDGDDDDFEEVALGVRAILNDLLRFRRESL